MPGERVPGENLLMAHYSVARWTAREALANLTAEGSVTKVPNVGTFVRQRPSLQRIGMERYARSKWLPPHGGPILGTEATDQGLRAHRQITEIAQVPPPNPVAERLNVRVTDRVWVRRRLVFLEQQPHQIADSYYPLDVATDTALTHEDTGPGGDFARLFDTGHAPTRIREEWTARMPTQDEIRQLALPPATPVLDFIRTIFDQNDQPVEVMLSSIAADATSMVYDFAVPE
jgi:GntR family transcriptional regulator